jgi:predicted aspartyl protease
MGKVTVTAKIDNVEDLYRVDRGEIPADQVRSVTVPDARVDTGAATLLLPAKLISQLGLFKTRQARGLGGNVTISVYSVVRLTIQGRECHLDVGEVPDDFPVIIGQIPLEMLDWVVDVKGQKLIGNPEHGGEHVIEVFSSGSLEDKLEEALDAYEKGDYAVHEPGDFERLGLEILRRRRNRLEKEKP